MHIQAIRFDRVFDVARYGGAFSFESDGKRTYGVTLPRKLIPNDGDVYLIAFETPGDFTTVLGWRTPQSDRMVVESESLLNVINSVELSYLLILPILASSLSLFGKAGLFASELALPVFVVAWVIQRRRGIRRALREVRPALPALKD